VATYYVRGIPDDLYSRIWVLIKTHRTNANTMRKFIIEAVREKVDRENEQTETPEQ